MQHKWMTEEEIKNVSYKYMNCEERYRNLVKTGFIVPNLFDIFYQADADIIKKMKDAVNSRYKEYCED